MFSLSPRRGRGDAGLGVAHRAAGGPELPMPCHAAVLGVESERAGAIGAAAAGDNDMVAQHEAPERPRPGRVMDHLRLSSCRVVEVFISGHAVAVRATELVPVLGMNSQAEGERKSDEGVFHGNPF